MHPLKLQQLEVNGSFTSAPLNLVTFFPKADEQSHFPAK